MNRVLVGQNAGTADRHSESEPCYRIVGKVKRQNAVNIESIQCVRPNRTALSNLNNATQTLVQLSKNGERISAKLMDTSEINVNRTKNAKSKTAFKFAERQTHKNEATKRGDDTAMAMTIQSNDKFCQYSRAMCVSHQQQQQKQNVPVFKSTIPNLSLRPTQIVARAVTRAQHRYIDIHKSNGECHRSVAISKDHCHITDATTADVNVLRTIENGQTTMPKNM